MTARIRIVLLIAIAATTLLAQQPPGQEFAGFVNANEVFGRTLLFQVHSSALGQNVAVSPLPVSFAFALLREASNDGTSLDQIQRAFQWNSLTNLRSPSRMLVALFQAPAPAPIVRPRSRGEAMMLALLDHRSPEELWISSTFAYRGKNMISRLFQNSERDFGAQFKALPPRVSPHEVDFSIESRTHLRTVWADNTFSMGTKKTDYFTLETGQAERVPMMVSELDSYRHGKTDDFETVELLCSKAYLQIVLPKGRTNILQLEAKLTRDNRSLQSSLKSEVGDVEIPRFSFHSESDIRGALEKMGVRRIFRDADSLGGLVQTGQGARLVSVSQKVEIEVNEQGIRANAKTVTNGVYGGIVGGQYVPFHMVVNRPFLFFIRDNVTDSLLFAGAVMDPTRH
jgi:serine protease inhibitor